MSELESPRLKMAGNSQGEDATDDDDCIKNKGSARRRKICIGENLMLAKGNIWKEEERR